MIRAANEAFLNLTDASGIAAVRGRSIADFLVRGQVDLRVLLDNVKRTGQLRLYATRLTTDFSGQIAVELSASWLNDRPEPGACAGGPRRQPRPMPCAAPVAACPTMARAR